VTEDALDGGVGKEMDRSVNMGRAGASLVRRGIEAEGALNVFTFGTD